MQHRLDELESKFSFQEDLLQELNKIVADQQSQIDVLQRRQQLLQEQISDLADGVGRGDADGAVQNERPPHY